MTSGVSELPGAYATIAHLHPSESQRSAVEAPAGPILVLAGPGAGKTFCLIERIHHLIEHLRIDPARICAFTFTNKAAEEIASRLEHRIGERADQVKRGTLHAFCAELLRELGERIELQPGFGIADEDYQLSVLARLRYPSRWRGSLLNRFARHRFLGDPLHPNDAEIFQRYTRFLEQRNVLDFDTLVLRAADLLRLPETAAEVRRRWDCVLIDEFQDLNRVQYFIVRELAREHRHVFAVGDDEQSIYSWAGADPAVFKAFVNDFGISARHHLEENRRCPRDVFSLARRLVTFNTPIFDDRTPPQADRESPFPVAAHSFATDDQEIAWVIQDIQHDREAHSLEWGEYALLYRRHEIGDALEGAFLTAGIPCRLAAGRALAEDPVVGYVLAALRVIACPGDHVQQERFLEAVLPRALLDDARARADEQGEPLLERLSALARELPKEHGDARKIRRGFYALRNLAALARRHTHLTSLVAELLSQRVGEYRTVLEEQHDELTDPAGYPEVERLAEALRAALADDGITVWLPYLGGVEIALATILAETGLRRIQLHGTPPPDAVRIEPAGFPLLGVALGVFKTAQLLSSAAFTNHFRDFTAVDLETTGRDTETAEIVEIAAVRVRDGRPVDEFRRYVRPRVPITPGAQKTHGITEADVAGAPFFEEVWPEFRAFCGSDVLVAHNGYQFDFPILRRMAQSLEGGTELCTYDTLPLARELHTGSARLEHLAPAYGIDRGTSHRALDDTRALAHVFLALGEAKVARARKTALVTLLDHLGIALALCEEEELCEEARLLRRLTRPYALGRYTDCLETYRLRRELTGDDSLPTMEYVIEQLGGEELMQRLRSERSADERYPATMHRMRRLLELSADGSLQEQIAAFLERVVLSTWDGTQPERSRVNLLTMHSTKGLEFSRVYIVGTEDAQLPGGSPLRESGQRELEEARRLLYVGMTRTKDRLVLTRVDARAGKPTGGWRFLEEMGLTPLPPRA